VHIKSLASILLIISIFSPVVAKKWEIPNFVADTIIVTIPGDSLYEFQSVKFVQDNRHDAGKYLGIGTKNKWHYIPVDQYYLLKEPLADLGNWYFRENVDQFNDYQLIVDNLTYWVDRNTLRKRGGKLNGYSRLVDSTGTTVKDWQWDLRFDGRRKEAREEQLGALIQSWLDVQNQALKDPDFDQHILPFDYRRSLIFWSDYISLQDGYIIDLRLSLDYPVDELESYQRGIRGLYFRRSAVLESIGLRSKDVQWYFRKGDVFLIRCGITGRFGFNSINSDEYDFVDWWNIFMLNISGVASIEYRPRYYRGIFTGIGMFHSFNILPEIIDRYEPGLLITAGVILP